MKPEEEAVLVKVSEAAQMVLEPYREWGEPWATAYSLELLRRAVEELEGVRESKEEACR